MDNLKQMQKSKTIINSHIKQSVGIIKEFISKYSLIPVLEKAFINDNFIYEKPDGSTNEDYKLSLYIGDLFLSYQNGKELEKPTSEQVESVFNTFLELVQDTMFNDIMENNTSPFEIDFKVLFKYTERSFFIPIMNKICESIIDSKFLQVFYLETGFQLYDTFTFNYVYKNLLFDRYEEKVDSLFLLSFEELFNCFYSIDPSITKERLSAFINYFTCAESNNSDFLPSASNPLIHKPFIQTDDKIICCDSLILVKNCFFILEEVLKKNEEVFTEYGASKGVLFEKAVQDIFSKLFPGASFYSDLEYLYPEDQKVHEADLLIDTGNYLLIVESKGRSFQENAKKGNEGSYKRSIEKILKKAHEQCKTTYKYLTSEDSVKFKRKGEEFIFSKKTYLDIYLVTIELDNLDMITSDIYKTLEVFSPNPIITFSLYDLIIIQDILNRGSIFLNYLEQRRGITREQKTTTSTEIDYLSYYINTGLFFEKQNQIIKEDFSLLSIANFSTEIEKYYLGESSEKPYYPISENSNLFLQQLNQCNPKFGLTIEKEFFSANIETQNNILSQIEKLKQQAQINGGSSIFSFVLESKKMGLSFICYNALNLIPQPNYFLNYIHDKQSQHSIKCWAFVIYSLNPYRINNIILLT